MCCLMECLNTAFQNAGNSSLFLCFISMLGGGDEWSYCEEALLGDTWAPWLRNEEAVPTDKPFVKQSDK